MLSRMSQIQPASSVASDSGVEASAEAYRQADAGPADIDTVQFYDSFTITAMLLLEDNGFCEKGEGRRGSIR